MSKYKFRIFVPFMLLIIFALIFLVSFILTSFASSVNTFKSDELLEVNLYELPKLNETVMEFQYIGIRKDVELTFDPKKLYIEQRRTLLNLFNFYAKRTSFVVMPQEYKENEDGTITYNPVNNPLRIVVKNKIEHKDIFSNILFKFAPSPTFTTPYYEFTIKENLLDKEERFEHILGGFNESVSEVSPIKNKEYIFVPKMFIKENRSFFVGKSPINTKENEKVKENDGEFLEDPLNKVFQEGE